jgi:hypothetical protein
MKESKVPVGIRIEPTALRGKWFEVNDLNHMATEPLSKLDITTMMSSNHQSIQKFKQYKILYRLQSHKRYVSNNM